ncbi:MAG: PcfJ domain-containing protein [Filomicrobium sp.]
MGYTAQKHPYLHWIAPRSAHRGLIRNNPWLPEACSKAAALFDDKSLQVPAVVLAAAHETAIDYIVQAPVLVLAATKQSDLAMRTNRERVAAHFKVVCSARLRLKDLMRLFQLAPQLRTLSGQALRRDHYRLLKLISDIPPSRLAQVIPKSPADQTAWLNATTHWRTVALRVSKQSDWIVRWAASNACHDVSAKDPTELIDFAYHNQANFDRRWNLTDAEAACARWHAELAEKSIKNLYSSKQLSEVADYGPLPIEADINDHQFIALRTRLDIFEEGRAMHHCVSVYASNVFTGGCWLYSIKKGGARVATLEVRTRHNGFELAQIKSHCNTCPPAITRRAAKKFLAVVNASIEQKLETGAVQKRLARRS